MSLGVPKNVTAQALVLYNRYLINISTPTLKGVAMENADEVMNRRAIKDVIVTVYDLDMNWRDRKYGDFITPRSIAEELD
jgi:hypothetical protein